MAWLARSGIIWRYPFGSEETINTCLTVDPSSVSCTIDAYTPSNILSMYIQTQISPGNIFIIIAFFSFPMTITCFTFRFCQERAGSPRFLVEARTALITAITTRVMLTFTAGFICHWIKWTSPGMTIADAHPSNRNILDRVVISSCDNGVNFSGVFVGKHHQVGIQGADPLKSQANVASRGKFQQFGRRIISTWSPIDQRDVNLSIL